MPSLIESLRPGDLGPVTDSCDIAIIGAGMAGASLAAECVRAGMGRIALLEAESTPGYHTTGRSAAFWEECYGGPEVVPLTLASGRYLREHNFLTPRGALYVGRQQDEAALDAFTRRFGDTGASFERIGREILAARVPALRGHWDRAIWQPDCADIDVAGLHQHYLAAARRGGVALRCRARVESLAREDGDWLLRLENGDTIRAVTIVNAAGAWADSIARLAGAAPLDIMPLRRTVAQLRIDPAPPPDQPLVLDISGRFYFKPEGERLWLSPHDEIPDIARDVSPEHIDVARAIDRMADVLAMKVEAVEHSWAGLRSFAPDRLPVYGFDAAVQGFFWFAGQGGYGIQTAPAAAMIGAALLGGLAPPAIVSDIDPAIYSPARF